MSEGNNTEETDSRRPVPNHKGTEDVQQEKIEYDTSTAVKVYIRRGLDHRIVVKRIDVALRMKALPWHEWEGASPRDPNASTRSDGIESSDHVEVTRDRIYKQGDIVLVNFPLPQGSLEPHYAIVVSSDEFFANKGQYMAALITSNQQKDNHSFLLRKGTTTNDGITGQVRCSVLGCFEQREIIAKASELKERYLPPLIKKIRAKSRLLSHETTCGREIG